MKITDMQLYPVFGADHDAVGRTDAKNLREACARYAKSFAPLGVKRGLMVILNPDFLRDDDNARSLEDARRAHPAVFEFAVLLDFRAKDSHDLLSRAAKAGARSLKFHPYRQKLGAEDIPKAADLAAAAERLGLYTTICCSYGTKELGRHSGVALAAALAGRLKGPIVMAHAGGAKILDAMLIAADAPNVFLDTSFSLDYYLGSSIEGDLAFAMRKLGPSRWMFGSDAPFVPQKTSIKQIREFFRRHRFRAGEIEEIFSGTARRVLG